jgi:exonuclease SbcC
MLSITKIHIQNFQSHEDTVLEFINGLNVIIGQSDTGKTAIIRAIKWVLYNEPRGTEFIRNKAKSACVTIEFSNHFSIIRERSQAKNIYKIINPEGNTTCFEGFGNEIPQEITKIHGIQEVFLDETLKANLNIADQLERPFLLSETGAVRAKALGRIVGLHIVDKAIKDSLVELKRETQTRERLEAEVVEIESELRCFDNLESLKERVEKSDILIAKLSGLMDKEQKLRHLKVRVESIDNEINIVSAGLEKLRNLEQSKELLNDCKLIAIKLKTMRTLKLKHDILVSNILKSGILLSKSKSIVEANKMFEKLEQLIKKQSKLKTYENRLTPIQRELKALNRIIEENKNYSKLEEIFDKIIKRNEILIKVNVFMTRYLELEKNIKEGVAYIKNTIVKMNYYLDCYIKVLKNEQKCPVCNSEINSEKIEEIIKFYKGGAKFG